MNCGFISYKSLYNGIYSIFYSNLLLPNTYTAYLFSLYVYLSQICYLVYCCISGIYSAYDVYANGNELVSYINNIKILDSTGLSEVGRFSSYHMWLHFGIYKLAKLVFMSNYLVVIYASLFNYNFPYFFLFCSSSCASVFVFGYIYTLFTGLSHLGISLFSIVSSSLSLYFDYCSSYMSFYYGLNLLICEFGFSIGCLLNCNLVSTSTYICNLYLDYICGLHCFSYSIYYTIYGLLNFSMCSILVNYNFFFFEYCEYIAVIDSYFYTPYLFINNDNVYSTVNMCISSIVIFSSSFMCSYSMLSDLIIPMNFFLESESFCINYYGSGVSYCGVIKSCYLTITDYLYSYISLLGINFNSIVPSFISVYVHNYDIILSYVSMYIFAHCINFYCDFYFYIEYIVVLYLFYILLNIHFVSSILYTFGLVCIFYRLFVKNISLFLDLYLDSSTYFLTGALCRMSKFVGRYRSSSELNMYNLA